MQPYIFVTTFNEAGYQQYGRKMLESFVANWPGDQQIIVYVEGFDLDPKLVKNSMIVVRDITHVKPLMEFKARHKDNPKANGYWPEGEDLPNFKYDAVRFSHKVYALRDAFPTVQKESKGMIWIDGDTITHRTVPGTFLTSVAPLHFFGSIGDRKQYGITYLGRSRQHSECGFVVYNTKHPMMEAFWDEFAGMYTNDTIFDLAEWHDSFVFDHVRKIYEAKGMVNNNLTPKIATGHPFINSRLGEYMDHMKGARKNQGRSRKSERFTRTSNESKWWK